MQRLIALSRSPCRIDPEGLNFRTSAWHFARRLLAPPLPFMPPPELSDEAGPANPEIAKLRNPTSINFFMRPFLPSAAPAQEEES
jgi:hypothetical protein